MLAEIDYSDDTIVRARAAAYALLLQWAKEDEIIHGSVEVAEDNTSADAPVSSQEGL